MAEKDSTTKTEPKGEDLVTVTFKCTAAQKATLIKKAVEESGLSLTDYLKYKVFEDKPADINSPQISTVSEVMTDEEKEALEGLISKQRKEISDLKYEIHVFRTKETESKDKASILPEQLAPKDDNAAPLSMLPALIPVTPDTIENEPFVKEFLDWSETEAGLKTLRYKPFFGEGLDLTHITRKAVLNATLEMGINYVMPKGNNLSHETYLAKHLDIARAAKEGTPANTDAIIEEGKRKKRVGLKG